MALNDVYGCQPILPELKEPASFGECRWLPLRISAGFAWEDQAGVKGVDMNFTEAIASAFQNYFNFQTRSRRSEYWYFTLFVVLVSFATALADLLMLGFAADEVGPLNGIFSLVTIIPSLAVSVRRLHDIDRSGLFLLLALIPIIGWIVLIYWACQPGTSGHNRFGDDPVKAGAVTA